VRVLERRAYISPLLGKTRTLLFHPSEESVDVRLQVLLTQLSTPTRPDGVGARFHRSGRWT
jgi:hypothetical protein